MEGVDAEAGFDAQCLLRGLQKVGIHQAGTLLADYGPAVPLYAAKVQIARVNSVSDGVNPDR
ncbi:hypothetical protein ACF1AX_36000 [Streptomyces sp. NPDC014802]|uniref:hypothetical protein n=1 Tax=Streptomyces sp. NPDC014802 TaxID=3364917 RepID=UPI0036FE7550